MSNLPAASDRRVNPGLRLIFTEVCETLRPFFEPAGRWHNQSHEHLAYRCVREQFPQLGAQESFVVVAAAKRLWLQGRFPPAP